MLPKKAKTIEQLIDTFTEYQLVSLFKHVIDQMLDWLIDCLIV